MTQIQSVTQALQILNDTSQDVYVREKALHVLAGHPTPANLARLVQALEDPKASVRWVAADVLAHLGDIALPPLLNKLVDEHNSVWLREGAYHVCSHSSSPVVHEQTQELQEALRGPAAEVATTDAACKLLYAAA